MDIASGIVETANALGMSPVDLATIISYETAGTFSPTQAGPTTQWGQHRGLIQFGEPQARQYGVDWNNPAASQLGADGAIVRYYRDNGWQPGMGMLDAYSIVNAGGPGLYHRSDANNGGAPGTVADKVNEQMAGHRRNAIRLLGGDFEAVQGSTPNVGGMGASPAMLGQPAEPQRASITPEMISDVFRRHEQGQQQAEQPQQQVQAPQITPRQVQAYQAPHDALAVALQRHQANAQRRKGLLNV
jgi:hypothetical protein